MSGPRAAEAGLNQYVDWTSEAAQGLQESVLGGDLVTVCATDDSVSGIVHVYFMHIMMIIIH